MSENLKTANNNQKSEIKNQKSKRPFRVTLLVLVVLSIAIIHLIRFVQAIRQWGFLETWPGVSPLSMAVTGFIWMVACLPVAWGLWRGRSWVVGVSQIAIPAFLLYAWIDRILIANRTVTMQRDSSWYFAAWATLIFSALFLWIITSAKTKAFFRRDS